MSQDKENEGKSKFLCFSWDTVNKKVFDCMTKVMWTMQAE